MAMMPIWVFLSLMYSDRYIIAKRDDKNAVGIQSENLVLKKSTTILLNKNSKVRKRNNADGIYFLILLPCLTKGADIIDEKPVR